MMMERLVARRFTRQLVTVVAVLVGATLLLLGLVPPQEAHGQEEKEKKSAHQKQQGGGKEKDPNQEEDSARKKKNDKEKKEKVLDNDPKGNEVVAGELIVTYKEEASEGDKEEAPEQVGGQVEEELSDIDLQLVSVPEVKDEPEQEAREEALEQKKEDLEQDPNVEAVEYNRVVKADWEPNDTYYWEPNTWWDPYDKRQWGYPKINAPRAWDYTQGSSGVKVAVIDSGIDVNHSDLQGKVVAQYDYVDNDSDASDGLGHGTHVAGTVAAKTNDGQGVAGTCPNCSLMSIRVIDNAGNGDTWDTIYGIHHASSWGAKVINVSLGSTVYSYAEEYAVTKAWDNGAVVVASAGNADASHHAKNYPAAYPKAIAVANTRQDDSRHYTSRSGDWVDVAAPGTSIYSTVPGYWYYDYSKRNFVYWSPHAYKTGTSMAAPHVSGLAGLLASRGHSNQGIRNRIEWTSKDLGVAGKDWDYGHGRIDAYGAVSCQWCRWYDY